jgi:hypothetical protein
MVVTATDTGAAAEATEPAADQASAPYAERAVGVARGAAMGGLFGTCGRPGTTAATGADDAVGPKVEAAAPAGWASAVRIASPTTTPAIPARRMSAYRRATPDGAVATAGPPIACPVISTNEIYHLK